MRFSQLFGQTLRDAPAEAQSDAQRLLTRAGYLRPLAAGQFVSLQAGQRSLSKAANLARRRLEALGAQEIGWLTTAPPAPNDLAEWLGREVQSYKHLPRLLYAVHNQPAAEDRPPFGLLPARASLALTIIGLESDDDKQQQLANNLAAALQDVLNQSGVQGLSADAAQALVFAAPAGETPMLACDPCGQTFTQANAPFARQAPPPQPPRPIEKVFTPNCKTIADLAGFLNAPTWQTAKAVLLMARRGGIAREQFVFAVVRGDTDLSETKLAAALGAHSLRPAAEDEIRAVGAVPGFASPVGLQSVFVVVDEAVANTPNLVSGANVQDYHLLNVNYGRDYTAQVVADIAAAPDDAACPHCAAPMRRFFASEIARISRMGEWAGCTFLGRDGKPQPTRIVTATLDLMRLLACAAEQNYDERGLALPIGLAPFQMHIVALKGGFDFAEQLYTQLSAAGIEVLYDDRDESPGVKFNDADLIGLPIRLTVAEKSLAQGGVEFKLRRNSERRVVGSAQAAAEVIAAIRALEAAPGAPGAAHPQ